MIILAMAGSMAAIANGCADRMPAPGAIYRCDEYVVFPDSVVSQGFTLAHRNGGIAIIRDGVVSHRPMHGPIDGRLSMSGSDTLLTDIFNQPEPQSKECPIYNAATPYEIILYQALNDPHNAALTLERQIKDGTVGYPETSGMGWPVVSSDAAWPIAAWEVYLATGDREWLQKTIDITSRLMADEMQTTFDKRLGLFRSLPPGQITGRRMPAWMDAADIAAAYSFKSNIERAACYDILCKALTIQDKDCDEYALRRDSLINATDSYFWTPDRGRYSEMLYGCPYTIQSPSSDNLAQAAGICLDIINDAMADVLVACSPIYTTGVPASYPSDTMQNPLATAFWNIAAARTGNSEAFNLSLASLAYQAATDPSCRDYLRAAVLHGIAGIRLQPDGMRFSPFVPEELDGEKIISGLHYREATLDIKITGTGNIVSTFAIDSEPSDDHIVPSSLTGHHQVSVTLVGFSDRQSDITVTQPADKAIQPAPPVKWTAPDKATVKKHRDSSTTVYLNGAVSENLQSQVYELKDTSSVTAVTFSTATDGNNGFADRTYLYIPSHDSISVDLYSIGRPGARSLKDKKLAKRYAESTRYKNSRIRFNAEISETADYYIQLVYLNGLGIVNPERHYALRRLSVNGHDSGLLVLPQLSPDHWRHDTDWQSLKGTSLPMRISLTKGIHEFGIDYFAPAVSDFNHDSNTLIPEKLIITKIN